MSSNSYRIVVLIFSGARWMAFFLVGSGSFERPALHKLSQSARLLLWAAENVAHVRRPESRWEMI